MNNKKQFIICNSRNISKLATINVFKIVTFLNYNKIIPALCGK